MFEGLYDSPWIATAALALVSLAGLAAWLRRGSFLVAYVVLFTIEILADALQAGAWSPLRAAPASARDAVAFGFVLAGDLRYFLLVERFARRPSIGPRERTPSAAWAAALGLAFVVPLFVLALGKAWPARFAEGRWSFLAYELAFVALASALRAVVLPRRLAAAPAPVRRWLLGTTTFEIVQYALWATADVVILAGVDAGFALRVVPNVMYYGLFLAFVAFRAPRLASSAEVEP